MASKPRAMPQLPQDGHQDQSPQHTGETHLAHILPDQHLTSLLPVIHAFPRILCLLAGAFSPLGLAAFKQGEGGCHREHRGEERWRGC